MVDVAMTVTSPVTLPIELQRYLSQSRLTSIHRRLGEIFFVVSAVRDLVLAIPGASLAKLGNS